MSSSQSGSQGVWCSECWHTFPRLHWRMHAHNSSQVTCRVQQCRRKAVGFRDTGDISDFLCSGHLLEAHRSGGQVTIVDGRLCGACDGRGRVQAQQIPVGSAGGQGRTCRECSGTGYDPTLPPPLTRRRSEERASHSPRPTRQESPGARRLREESEKGRETTGTESSPGMDLSEAARQQRLQRAMGSSTRPAAQPPAAQPRAGGGGRPPITPRTVPTGDGPWRWKAPCDCCRSRPLGTPCLHLHTTPSA